ncbi:MAG: hypothetical protein KF760_25335 [Candidatus Eremiobacteraeota bacterium]|nr:hypothetical protein [Candidatus Eremiobacteraeota bacterium]MCW5871449.1 hypothetical protein [Candidatus Eremiobacteraeota bacterium]
MTKSPTVGGIGVKIIAPGEVRELWSQIRRRLGSLVRSKAGREILSFYLSFQADDGLDDGSWHRNGEAVYFFFGDAAGLCYLEMDLCHHWVSLVAAELGMGEKPLQDLLEKTYESSFVLKKGKIVRVSEPGPCQCELCQRFRPQELKPTKEPKSPQPAAPNSTPLSQAKLHTNIKTQEPIVALDLCSAWGAKVPASTYQKLPGFPLKALNLKGQQCFSLPPAIFQCTYLEVLGAANTLNTKRAVLSADLARLQNLKGLEISLPSQEMAGLEIISQLSNLEILDGYWSSPQFPDHFAELHKLRHLNVSRQSGLERLRHLPIESLVAWEKAPDWPVRYFEGPFAAFAGDLERLEFLTLTQPEVPEALKEARNLRGLALGSILALPDWLPELPYLEHLQIGNYNLPFDPNHFRVLERLPRLRSLFLDIRIQWKVPPALAQLRLPQIQWLSLPAYTEGDEPLPADLQSLQILHIGHHPPEQTPECKIVSNPNAWTALSAFRAMRTSRAQPEWWLSRFQVNNPVIYEEFSNFYA